MRHPAVFAAGTACVLVAAIAAVGTFAIVGGRPGGEGDAPRAGMRLSPQPRPLHLDWLALLTWPTPPLQLQPHRPLNRR